MKDWLNCAVFIALGLAMCRPPSELPNARPSNALKAALPGLDGVFIHFFCVVSGLQCVRKHVAWIQEQWQCSIMRAFMGGMLGQRTCFKARRPALVYANIRLYVFSFIGSFVQHFWGRKWGV